MFSIFKKRQKQNEKLDPLATNIATIVNMLLLNVRVENHGDLPRSFESDKFFVGYISGVSGCGARIVGSTKSEDTGYMIHKVLDQLFPGKGYELLNAILEWKESGDQVFKDAALLGMKEFLLAHKALTG
jgi:hypothetical protein